MYLKCEEHPKDEFTVSVKMECNSDEEFANISDKAFELLREHDVGVTGDGRGSAYISFNFFAVDKEDYDETLGVFLKAFEVLGFELID